MSNENDDNSIQSVRNRLVISVNNYSKTDQLLWIKMNLISKWDTQVQLTERVGNIKKVITELRVCGETVISVLNQLQELYYQNPQFEESDTVALWINRINTQASNLDGLVDKVTSILTTDYDCEERHNLLWKRKSEKKNIKKRGVHISETCRKYLSQRDELNSNAIKQLVRSCQLMSGELTLEMERVIKNKRSLGVRSM